MTSSLLHFSPGLIVLGPAGPVRQGVKRLLLALPAYLFTMAVLLAAMGLGHVRPGVALIIAAYVLGGWGVFYGLLRTGFTAQRKEATLAFPQVLFALGGVGLSYALIEASRGLALQWVTLIVVYDMRRLSARQAQIATVGGMVLLNVMLLLSWRLGLTHLDLQTEAVNLVAATLTMPALYVISSIGRRVHHRRQDLRSALSEALTQVKAQAIRDGLTQLFNRGHMRTLLEEQAQRQKRSGEPFCLALLDLDFFKRINDEHGHAVGDAVLRDFSQLAQAAWREVDLMARWGGEEFLVMFCGAQPAVALQALARLRDALAAHPWNAHAEGLRVTFSAGLCEHPPGEDLHQTLERADAALYRAKALGRDQAVIA